MFIRNIIFLIKIGTSLPSTGLLGVYQWLTNHVTHLSSVRRDKEYENRFLLIQNHVCYMCQHHDKNISSLKKNLFASSTFWSIGKVLKSCQIFAASKFMNVEISAEYKLPVGTLVAPMPSSAKKPCNSFHKKQKKRTRFFIFWLQERFSLPILSRFYVSNSPSRVWVEEWLLMDRKSLLMGTKHWVETVNAKK